MKKEFGGGYSALSKNHLGGFKDLRGELSVNSTWLGRLSCGFFVTLLSFFICKAVIFALSIVVWFLHPLSVRLYCCFVHGPWVFWDIVSEER